MHAYTGIQGSSKTQVKRDKLGNHLVHGKHCEKTKRYPGKRKRGKSEGKKKVKKKGKLCDDLVHVKT